MCPDGAGCPAGLASRNTAAGEHAMKKHEIEVGGMYVTKVGGRQAEVRIDRVNPRGGWDATSLTTNKKVRIKNPQQLRPAAAAAEAPAGAKAPGRRPAAPKAERT